MRRPAASDVNRRDRTTSPAMLVTSSCMSDATSSCMSDVTSALTLVVVTLHLLTSCCATTIPPTPASSSTATRTWSLPFNATIVTIELTDLTWPFAKPKILPVMHYAVDQVNRKYSGIINFQFVFGEGSCDRVVVGVAAAKVSCENNITVFVGPACSKAAETIAYMANDWNVPIITPIGNTENIGDKTIFPRLTRINPLMQSSIVDSVFRIMRKHKWKHVGFFFDKDDTMGDLFGESFSRSFKTGNEFSWNSYELYGQTFNREMFRVKLKDAATRARVFIMCVANKTLRDLMLEAYSLGYSTSKEFVFFIILSIATVATDANTWKLGNGTKEQEMLKASFGQTLFLHIDDTVAALPVNFSREMRQRSLVDYGYDYKSDEPSTNLAQYFDAVQIYATVLNETINEGNNPYDGLAITRKMWNRTFNGMMGLVVVNKDGDRNSDVTITALNPVTGKFQKYAMFESEKSTMTSINNMSFPWSNNGGVSPPDEPACGFTGVLCTYSEKSQVIGGLAGFFGAAVFVGGMVSIVMFRRWKSQSERDLWWWKIDPADLFITDRKFTHSILSLTSKTSLRGSRVDTDSVGVKDGLLAVYRGQMVRLRPLPIHPTKQVDNILMEFKMVRDLSHNNLLKIFGACLEENLQALVIEHCSKGSLQDLLGNTNLTLDAQFKFSLCTDIVNGLCYLHESPIKCHGRLNSEVCLVDNRFSVKLADFGLPSLYSCFFEDVHSQEYKTTSLWKAPEILRTGDRRGTREGDIYSFSIILAEVITRDCPYSNEILYLTIEEILEKVRQVSSLPFRPIVEVPIKMSEMKLLMEKCWEEIPRDRPTAQVVKTAIKKIALSLGETGNLLDNLMRRMELYANNLEKLVEDKTVELREEKKKSEELLYQILPRSVADRLKVGLRIEPESYESVTIYFSDIVGFTSISAQSTPMQVVDLLNDLYSCFDAIVEEFDVYKVETIGDAYMVVSGLPQRNGNLHAVHIARMSLKLLKAISQFKIRHMHGERMRLRIGLHSGPVCAGVVGLKMPRYCLFGDTVNTASRMESHGEAMMIHMSPSIKAILELFGTFEMTPRGDINIKGKGIMKTYWLTKECENKM